MLVTGFWCLKGQAQNKCFLHNSTRMVMTMTDDDDDVGKEEEMEEEEREETRESRKNQHFLKGF